jgi:DNA (cytosine-5)-methyltransferase 1
MMPHRASAQAPDAPRPAKPLAPPAIRGPRRAWAGPDASNFNFALLTPGEFSRGRPYSNAQTVWDAIGDLPALEAGGIDPNDPLHCCSALSPLNLARMRTSKPGGTWRGWPENLVAECHRKQTGQTYPSVYRRMVWDEPAPTITTQFYGFGNGRFGHPEQDRAISLCEGAVFQTFPRDYQFASPGEPTRFKNIGRMIGNAVPVVLGQVVGASVHAAC